MQYHTQYLYRLMGFRGLSRSALLLLSFLLIKGEERTSAIMDEISSERLREHVESLHFDRSPECGPAHLEKAARYIELEFLEGGHRVWRDSFQWEGQSFHNIVAEKRGEVSPDQIYILAAHYDTVPGSPGADDNASSVAVLLEVARTLGPIKTRATLRFIAFALEEYGFVGSTDYASRARKCGENVAGMISLEMVGFTGPKQNYPSYINPKYYPVTGDFIGVIGNERSERLAEEVSRSLKRFVPKLPVEVLVVPGNGNGMEEVRLSDHRPFWDQGFQALMVTDTAFLRNPHYHLPTDTIETLDFEFMRKVAVGMHYSLVELAK